MKELRRMTLVILAAIVALVALPAVGHAGSLTAPSVTCTLVDTDQDTINDTLSLSWTVPTGTPAADKYAVQIDCVNDSTETVVKFKTGTSDCQYNSTTDSLKPGRCNPNVTSISVPIADLVQCDPITLTCTSAGTGDICTIKVRGLHKGGNNSDPPHATGSITCAALP